MGVNVDRVELVSVVSELRKAGVSCFSVPIEYMDNPGIDVAEAKVLAKKHAKSMRCAISESGHREGHAPLFWIFDTPANDDDRAGGVVIVDRLDGHIWRAGEYEEYMYDYNNIF
ncbi:hypothetical protein [Paraburkholderia megapolitana]|uniref:hypothetical protein n=1 Tax=Paraburkholderia megapolitana TaxID=420953 RepID=UPI000B8130C8|nr:hypothetical protein [Paraburkholderia megapolitana]QDQ84984.1 hypothetical protein FNZ07_28525 [Paraburkholderia megapolitana]